MAVKDKDKEKKTQEIEYTEKKSNLGDTATIKRLLDDKAVQVILDELNYEEDITLSNMKLVVGFSGVGAALVSHIYPGGFPKNWWVLLLCCFFYFFCSGVLQFILSFLELESVLMVHNKKGKTFPGLNIAASLPRFQEMYIIAITELPTGMSLLKAPKFRPENNDCYQLSLPVTKYFDEEGIFHEELFAYDVKKFMTDYENPKKAEEPKKDK